jgi:hypothetical protein
MARQNIFSIVAAILAAINEVPPIFKKLPRALAGLGSSFLRL